MLMKMSAENEHEFHNFLVYYKIVCFLTDYVLDASSPGIFVYDVYSMLIFFYLVTSSHDNLIVNMCNSLSAQCLEQHQRPLQEHQRKLQPQSQHKLPLLLRPSQAASVLQLLKQGEHF